MTTLQVYAHRLSDSSLSPNLRVTIANELRDQVEMFQTLEYPKFLSTLIPIFMDILQNGNPVFQSGTPEQKLRNIILEIIYRLPQTEPLKEYAHDLCIMLMNLIRVENEDNAVVCAKIIIDLHRAFRNLLEDQVEPFLDIVLEIFKNMEQTPGINPLLFASPRPNSPAEVPESPSKPLQKSMHSFKVLTECPIIVVLLFQTNRRIATENIMKFVPLIFQILSLQAKPQAEAASAAQARGEIFVGVSPEIRNRAVYNDFIVAQVKTMSFLAYILRSYTALLRPFQNQIPDFALRLLRECPPESTATRKELLVAIRHILSTDFRASFVPKIDLLLNEKVLIGAGVTSHDTLRPLAYSMLADLIHHIRTELSPTQLYRTVYMYTRNLHDATLAPSIQTMCGKLLLNLIDCIIKIPNKAEGRELLMRILDAFASKFASLNIIFKTCFKQHVKKNKSTLVSNNNTTSQLYPDNNKKVEIEDSFDYDRAKSIQTSTFILEPQHDGIKDGRFLFKNFTVGLKSLFIGLRHCNPSPSADTNLQTYSQFARGFSQEDIHTLIRLFREGLMCFEYYNIDQYGPDGSLPSENVNYEELKKTSIGCNDLSLKIGTQASAEKETLETFATVFTLLDPAIFQEVFVSQMGFFFDQMLINTSLVHIVQYFLVNEISSQGFASILFKFLIDRLENLGGANMHYSAVQLHLFRLSFMAINLFPDLIEPVLQPYLSNLVNSCFKLSTKAEEPANYFLLLRAMFKSIGGGRFELLYKEVTPLLHMILESLNSLLTLAHKPEMRNLFVELALAVPVRLSTLLPFLPYLMKPLVIALQADNDLVAQGLRTIELCNDNLNSDFLDSVMEPVMKELMMSLYKLLKPSPYNQQNSHAAMRILGKFGGRNRRILSSPPTLEYEEGVESGVSLEIVFDPSTTPHTLPLDRCLEVACKALENPTTDLFYKKHGYEFIKANIITMLDIENGFDNLAQVLCERVKKHLLESSSPEDNKPTEAMDTDETPLDDMQEEKSDDLKPKRLEGRGYTKYLSKRLAQEEAFRTMLVAILKASTLPTLSEDAWLFFENICHHFMLLHIGEAIEAKRTCLKPLSNVMSEKLSVQNLSTTILVDAIVEVMSSENAKLRERAEESLQLCFDIAVKILGGKEHVWKLPIFRVLASQFSSYCYKQEWYYKKGGCLGISIISSQLDMGTRWMREHEVDFIRALLFVLKDASPEMANVNTAEATQTLAHVLKVCNRPDDDESQESQQKFQNLIALLLSELSNSNSTVRETIQSSFQLLADLTGNEVTELLAPVRERLVAPIFAKPLRALPFAMQIGHIDAITYCLTLRPPFLEFNDELIRLLHEVLALADAEDQALVSKGSQHKNETPLMNLRIVCIQLLSAAMACSDFSSPRQIHTRARIIQVFFKSLYSSTPEVVEAAHRGLKQVLSQSNKLPKELLQQGLRPILTTLSSHKTLSVPSLEGLARLLELLTNYFKVEIGKKLLDHLKLLAETSLLQEAAGTALCDNGEIKVMAAILDVFHLLPPTAHIFMDEYISAVLEMELHLRRSFSSPFRSPVVKYLNRYPSEAVAYFFDKFDKPRHLRLFIDVLGSENAAQVREEVSKNMTQLIEKTFKVSDNSVLNFQGVLMVREIVRHDPDWLSNQPDVLACLLDLWRSPSRFASMRKDDEEGVRVTRESFYLSQIFISYLRKNPENVDIVFEIANLFAQDSVMDLSYLREFFFRDVALQYTAKNKRLIFEKFFQHFHESSSSTLFRMMFLRHVINPSLLVAMTRENGGYREILDAKMMEQLVRKVWAHSGSDGADENQYSEDSLRIELLQLTAMIVQYAPDLLTDLRKEVIKFGWNYIRLEDSTCKQAAYVLIARFITAFETPSKIVIQIYAALLRAHLSEARTLVRQGLDIISPVLPSRIPQAAKERVPSWIRLTRKVIVEDTHSISQLVNVYQLLVRHPDLFYDYREHFLPQIVNALPKLGLFQNATPENKLLTVELAELVFNWEQKRLKKDKDTVKLSEKRVLEPSSNESPAKKSRTESGEVKSASEAQASGGPKEYAPPLTLRENMIGYLVRLACSIYNPSDMIQRRLIQRVLELINRFLDSSVWPDVHVKFIHLERALTIKELNDILLSSVCSALEILCIDISHKPNEWFILNMNQLFRLLENSIKSDHVRIHSSLQPVLSHIFRSINQAVQPEIRDEPPHPDVAGFVALVESTITDGVASANNVYGVLKLLQAYSTGRSEKLDQFVPGIVKLLQKLTREHIMAVQPPASSANPDSQVNLLILSLKLLRMRVSYLGDQRRGFLTCLVQLIEKSPDVQLLHAILDMLKEWTLDKTETFPTMKEKAGILVKMMSLQSRNDSRLTEDYLDLILKIYSNPSFARTELTARLEEAFLCGTRSENPQVRSQFMRVFDRSLSRILYTRLNYILGTQNWESLSDSFWIHQALDLLFGAVHIESLLTPPHVLRAMSLKVIGDQTESVDIEVSPELSDMIDRHKAFLQKLQQYDVGNIVINMRHLQYLDDKTCFKLWVDMFPMAWSVLSSTECHDIGKIMIQLLSKEYHDKQADLRPNVIQALMAGLARADVDIKLPPHLIKYLGKTHDAWHISIEILQKMIESGRLTEVPNDDLNSQERTLDALTELFSDLNENDIFYGLWRRHCTYIETNIALSFEQSSMWSQAQTMYENAQIKARNGVLPFTESEYMLWENHWISCTERLQQWDVLADLAKYDNDPKLLLDCAWRLSNWASDRETLEQAVTQAADHPTPELKVYEAFLVLMRSQAAEDRGSEFTRICEEGIQLSLKKWCALPQIVSHSHIPLLQLYQQFLELHEASQLFVSLGNTNAQNLEQRSTEIRGILGSWRERLPNVWDDMNVWSQLVGWRQHIFSAINRTYLPLIPLIPNQAGNNQNTFAYRGYHETAWIINRFSRVARKHNLDNVCSNSLAKIYTLPNIEIQEAFLKLREQAKCHYKHSTELSAGLDLINNTNLSYFNKEQKAEFYVLKGQFLAKLNYLNEANEAFVTAAQIEVAHGRAWAAWGEYNDRMFKENPQELNWATHAVSCYLQAAGIFKNAKSRKYLLRILWLLSLDDQNGTISSAFEVYKGEIPVWYWITFIPQLLMGIQQKEGKHARTILMRIAKQYPQALHFQLRTAKEEVAKRAQMAAAVNKQAEAIAAAANGSVKKEETVGVSTEGNKEENAKKENGVEPMEVDKEETEKIKEEDEVKKIKAEEESMEGKEDNAKTVEKNPVTNPWIKPPMVTPNTPTHPFDEIMAMLKTGYPLLALSMETMVDQIQLKFKPQADEDMYRLVVALYNEGAQQLLTRLMNPNDTLELTQATISNIARFADSLYPGHMKTAFVRDFATSKLNLEEYVAKLRLWRDKFEAMLDARPRKQKLEASSHYLVEFQHQKFDDVEIPGQYLLLTDNANGFLHIDRFLPKVEVIRSYGNCFRRVTIRGHDGSLHPFVIQNPAARQFRREERLMQLFRLLNGVLEHKRESRIRNLTFHLPSIVPLAPNVRMVSDDPSYSTLYEIYEDHCDHMNMHKDDPLVYFIEKLKGSVDRTSEGNHLKAELLNLRMEINEDIAKTMVPSNILSKYMLRTLRSYSDYWFHRKRFISQYATATFMSYLFSIGHRTPHKITISRKTGNIWMTELLPGWSQNNPLLGNGESVPFRFTPNIQEYMTAVGVDGLFSSCLMATARSLTEELELDQYLYLFVRDELITWHIANQCPATETQFRERVQANVLQMMTKAQFLACKADIEKASEEEEIRSSID
ncbi:hypothetical protein G6F43_002312 [Rhizopus delemar]|nr:hypothetical protein G6F43_002312 [Rhizopus delemar]